MLCHGKMPLFSIKYAVKHHVIICTSDEIELGGVLVGADAKDEICRKLMKKTA